MTTEVAPQIEASALPHEREESHALRRLIGAGTLALACGGVLGGVAGAAEAAFTPTTIELGPHTATAQATLSDRFEFDFGPIGSADTQSTWPVGGFKVTVKGIPVPAEQSALASASSVTAQYETLLADPQHIKSAAVDTVTTRIWHNATEGAALFGAAGLGSLLLAEPGKRRRREQQANALTAIDELSADDDQKATLRSAVAPARIRSPLRWSAAALTTALVMSCSGDIVHADPTPRPTVDPALAGTPFADYAMHGELLRLVIDEGATRVEQFVTATEAFYNKVATNFNDAFIQKFDGTKLDHSGLTYALSVSDNHCNIGMDRVHGAIANAFGVDIVVDSGDMTMGGTAAEEECVSAEADAVKAKGRDLLLAAGNHDSPTIERLAAKHGFQILHLDGTVTSHGLRFLGEDDVNESTFGTPLRLRGSETVADETAAVTTATQKLRPDVLVTHEPEMAVPAVTNGDTPFSISGHLHTWHAPELLNAATDSYQFIEGTSGGAKPNALTIGTLQQAAIDTILVFDNQTKRAVGYYVVTANTDKSVTISDYVPMSQQFSHQQTLAAK